jgi:glutamate 5-kinase
LKNELSKFGRITIKGGSNVITQKDGSLNVGRILRLVEDIAILCKQGKEVILVTSGAVAAGRSEVIPSKRTNVVGAKQIWASIGQVKLMAIPVPVQQKRMQWTASCYQGSSRTEARPEYEKPALPQCSMQCSAILNENDSISIDD